MWYLVNDKYIMENTCMLNITLMIILHKVNCWINEELPFHSKLRNKINQYC